MTGRIEVYIHRDSITANKGGALVKVTSQTDFAARTQEFIAFACNVAKMAYAANSEVYAEVIDTFADIETKRQELSKLLKEQIKVEEIRILTL
jgi:translation elongation factor EF-Ts